MTRHQNISIFQRRIGLRVFLLLNTLVLVAEQCPAQKWNTSMVRPKPTFIKIDLPIVDGELIFKEVVQQEGTSKDLYLRSKTFFVNTFNKAKDVVQFDDAEILAIVSKGVSSIIVGVTVRETIKMHYTIKIESRDGRYRYEISDIYYTNLVRYVGNHYDTTITPNELFNDYDYFKSNGKPRDRQKSYKIATEKEIGSIVSSIKHYMSRTTPITDDW